MRKKLTKKQDLAREAGLIRWGWRGFWLALVLSVLAGFVWPAHGYFEAEHVVGFYALFGMASCVVIIVVSKILGPIFKRRTDYYEGDEG